MEIINLLIVIVLVCFSGLFSGLTLGLMGLNKFVLKRKAEAGNKDAQKVYPLRKKGNLLLCTLILGNVTVNAVLSIFLGSLTAGVIAGLIAITLITLFGEIFPQAIFSRYALMVGARLSELTYVMLLVFYPVAKPLAIMLDGILGEELPRVFSKKELELLLEDQAEYKRSQFDKYELDILKGGLKFSEKTVKEIMTPMKEAYYVHSKDVLTKDKLDEIKGSGHSRIPVKSNTTGRFIGLLYAKDLINCDLYQNIQVKSFMRKSVKIIKEEKKLDGVLDLFKRTKVHLFFVINSHLKVVGIVTLEDVIEEIVGEIVDEYDALRDVGMHLRKVHR